MEEKHKCKLCCKSFVNGRALGGHMRSHMLPIQLYPQPESASSSMADDDRESETESSKKPTRKRSRFHRRSIYVSSRHQQSNGEAEIKKTSQEVSESCTEHEPMSSVSDAEEDVALSLMLLSRDKWEKEEEESEERWNKRKWFECETCEKVFKSYQALGGHRASHKKKRAEPDQGSDDELNKNSNNKKKKKKSSNSFHECPICYKVFSSGQALGGHKRSHATKRGIIISLIDLNLPAPSEEEDLVVSSVYNA